VPRQIDHGKNGGKRQVSSIIGGAGVNKILKWRSPVLVSLVCTYMNTIELLRE
jgi:hypothetical protein